MRSHDSSFPGGQARKVTAQLAQAKGSCKVEKYSKDLFCAVCMAWHMMPKNYRSVVNYSLTLRVKTYGGKSPVSIRPLKHPNEANPRVVGRKVGGIYHAVTIRDIPACEVLVALVFNFVPRNMGCYLILKLSLSASILNIMTSVPVTLPSGRYRQWVEVGCCACCQYKVLYNHGKKNFKRYHSLHCHNPEQASSKAVQVCDC